MVPLIGPGYRPVDADERGMWQQMERVEEEIAGSNLVVKDPALTAYLQRPDRQGRRPRGAAISASIWRAFPISTRSCPRPASR